jgi:DNA-binding GntR family transcriptional regulator
MSTKILKLRTKSAPRSAATTRPRGKLAASPEQILEALRRRIAGQEIPPGAKLREQDLAAEFGVPRTRIRDVFGALESRGLIERIPNRGAVVTRLDMELVFKLYDVREVLEGLCARLATENMPPESWQDLVELYNEPMETFLKAGDFDSYVDGYDLLRQRTIAAAGNPIAAQMLDSIYERTNFVIRRIIILPGRAETGLAQHRAVLAAMRRGDGAEAERLKRLNMRSAKESLNKFRNYVL